MPRSKTTTNYQQQQQQRNSNTQYHPTPDGMGVRPTDGMKVRGGGVSRGGRVSKAWLGFQLQHRSFSADGGWGNNIMSTIKTQNNHKPCYRHISRIRIVIIQKPKQTPSTTHAFSKYTLYIGIGTNLLVLGECVQKHSQAYPELFSCIYCVNPHKKRGGQLKQGAQHKETMKESESVFF